MHFRGFEGRTESPARQGRRLSMFGLRGIFKSPIVDDVALSEYLNRKYGL